MSMSPISRARRFLRVWTSYVSGWRGVLLLLAAVLSAAIVGLSYGTAGQAFVTFLIVSILFGAITALLANQERRTENQHSRLAASAGDTSVRPVAATGVDTPRAAVGGGADPDPDEEPLVSIVVTTWNEARFVETAIESIRSQTFGAFECIVVDDASTDDTVDRILGAVGDDRRFRILRMEENRGLAAARNEGLAHVRTPYVAFLDGDDFLYPASIQTRLEHMSRHAGESWVAGVYCQWANVPESARVTSTPKPAPQRSRVTWLTSLTDVPFIATAPLLRADVARAVGGFPDVDTAEDALFWNAVLREGYVFLPVHEVGVAYRMKRSSMFRRTAVDHASLVADALAGNGRPDPDLAGVGPYPYREACTGYMWDVTRMRRTIGALASAVESGDDVAAAAIADTISRTLLPYHVWELPIDDVIRSQANRACRHVPDTELAVHRERTIAAMNDLLQGRIGEVVDAVARGRRLIPDDPDPAGAGHAREIRISPRIQSSPGLLSRPGSLIDGSVILMPAAAYHVDETGAIAEELEKIGIRSVVVVGDRRWPSVEKAQAAYRTPVLATVEAGPWLERAAAVVVMNDWGEEYRQYVDAANELGVPTFAKVEGVQDFADDDVHWDRKAYQRAGWVLAQGSNDVAALPGRDTIVVSNNRLEEIWLGPERTPGPPLVVVNLNFTYGVLEDARDMWISSVAEACERVRVPYLVSLHPAERDRFAGRYPVATVPMRHLLTEASVLVSRFSTVPFEAMARGVPFVYHNPHGETVPTFTNPDGAFDVTTSASELADALEDALGRQTGYRQRASSFFLRQVAVDEAVRAPVRAAGAIAERLIRT